MKKIVAQLIIVLSTTLIVFSQSQTHEIDLLFQNFRQYYYEGEFVKAENALFSILKLKDPIDENYKTAVYINLGAIYMLLSRYDVALYYNIKAENLIIDKNRNSVELATIYLNKAFIYNIQKSFGQTIEYLEKSIRIFTSIGSPDKSTFQNLSSAYLNIGIAYYETENFKEAAEFFNKSSDLKIKYNLTGLALVYLNIAKNFAKTGSLEKAEEFYQKSISAFVKEYGSDYYRMVDVYFDYGLFLRSVGRNSDAMEVHKKALAICLKNYGTKHTYVSLAYKHIGDDFIDQNNYDSALYYYQKSLIAVVRNFNDTDIFSNPSIDSAIFDIRLLDNLKSKARALKLFAGQQKDKDAKLRITRKSVETVELAIRMIDRIRNNYPIEESRIYLADNEKETYFFATELANALYDLTGDNSDVALMYSFAQKAKGSVLKNEITQNELFYASAIPDSLRNRHNILSGNISAYNNLIREELRKKEPDDKKITLWKDALFDMNRDFEKTEEKINTQYPEYGELLRRTEPVTPDQIQKNLGKDETIIDYLLSNQDQDGKRKLYAFLITKDRLDFREENLDSLFSENASVIHRWYIASQSSSFNDVQFKSYTGALYYMYKKLITPVEGDIKGKRLIIIPDEEIAWLPFDAFLTAKPGTGQSDYEGLHYLIYDYAISYRYFSSLSAKKSNKLSGNLMVYAFAPDYSNKEISPDNQDQLRYTGDEINAALKVVNGRKLTGAEATVSNFAKVIRKQAIIHLAMHSLSDSTNSKYSYLMFEPDSVDVDGRLYNYEISLSRINSPMVVLSACNSGTGTLYHGEGVMSLARGFILAGASSVIRTSWEVNDETSAAIISDFYSYLSKGKTKDEALRLAKIDYIKTNPPVYTNPYYWAAYEVLGDNSPVLRKTRESTLIILIIIIAVAGAVWLAFYLRRRNNFSARSL